MKVTNLILCFVLKCMLSENLIFSVRHNIMHQLFLQILNPVFSIVQIKLLLESQSTARDVCFWYLAVEWRWSGGGVSTLPHSDLLFSIVSQLYFKWCFFFLLESSVTKSAYYKLRFLELFSEWLLIFGFHLECNRNLPW